MHQFLLIYYTLIGFCIVGYLWFHSKRRPKPPSPPRLDAPMGVVRYVADCLGLTLDDVGIRYTRSPLYAYHMGQRYEGVGEHDLAVSYYAQAVEGDPEWAEARYRLAMNYIRSKQYDKARQQVERLELLNGDYAALVKEHLPFNG